MSYTYNFGNTNNSSGKIPIDVSGCWPNLAPQSQQRAEEIRSIIEQFPHASDQLAKDFKASMDEARGAGLCPFVDGTGPIIENAKAVLKRARDMKANPPPPPAPPTPPPPPPGAMTAASPTGAGVPAGSVIPPAPDFFDPGPVINTSPQGELPLGLMVGGALALVAVGTAIYLLV